MLLSSQNIFKNSKTFLKNQNKIGDNYILVVKFCAKFWNEMNFLWSVHKKEKINALKNVF